MFYPIQTFTKSFMNTKWYEIHICHSSLNISYSLNVFRTYFIITVHDTLIPSLIHFERVASQYPYTVHTFDHLWKPSIYVVHQYSYEPSCTLPGLSKVCRQGFNCSCSTHLKNYKKKVTQIPGNWRHANNTVQKKACWCWTITVSPYS